MKKYNELRNKLKDKLKPLIEENELQLLMGLNAKSVVLDEVLVNHKKASYAGKYEYTCLCISLKLSFNEKEIYLNYYNYPYKSALKFEPDEMDFDFVQHSGDAEIDYIDLYVSHETIELEDVSNSYYLAVEQSEKKYGSELLDIASNFNLRREIAEFEHISELINEYVSLKDEEFLQMYNLDNCFEKIRGTIFYHTAAQINKRVYSLETESLMTNLSFDTNLNVVKMRK